MRAARRRGEATNPWPGYVDALATLLMVIIFVLLVFVLAQGFLSVMLASRDRALDQLDRQVAALAEALQLERGQRADSEARLGEATRAGEQQARMTDAAQAQAASLGRQVEALRTEMARLSSALGATEVDRATQITDLRAQLNAALAARVEELQRYRSDFFGRLREVLGDRPELRIAGDRFIVQSEVLFPPASAELSPTGERQLRQVARTLIAIAGRIPPEIAWVLRVDGHADRTPIRSPRFASNWELSAARAIAVGNLLVAEGLPASRVAAAAFADQQPLDNADTPEAYARNRRIELRLTDR